MSVAHGGCHGRGGHGQHHCWSRRRILVVISLRSWCCREVRAGLHRTPVRSGRRLQRPHGGTVWLPEAAGPVDMDEPAHRMLVNVLAAPSQREVVWARQRTFTALTAQTVEQGRFQGGQRPYGYRVVDAGPHPNRAHAAGASAAAAGPGSGHRGARASSRRAAGGARPGRCAGCWPGRTRPRRRTCAG
jgi:hypothetical protein